MYIYRERCQQTTGKTVEGKTVECLLFLLLFLLVRRVKRCDFLRKNYLTIIDRLAK